MDLKKEHSAQRKPNLLLLLACGGMEFSWLYAWAAFIMLLFVQRPFPLFEACGSFALASALTVWSRGRSLRIVQVLVLQLCGFLLTASLTVHNFYYPARALWDKRWILEFFYTSRGALEGFTLFALLGWLLIFWGVGVMLSRKTMSYSTIGSRFDLGIVALFGVLLLKIPLQAELKLDMALLEHLLFPFFLFSVLAFSLARNRNDAQKDFLAGYRELGAILSFSAIILLGSAGIVALFLPYLTRMAETTYGILKVGTAPLLPYLEDFLRFIFGSVHFRVEPPSISAGSPVETFPQGSGPAWLDGLDSFMGLLSLGFGILTAFLLLVIIIKFLWPWLMSRTASESLNDTQKHPRGTWFRKLWSLLRFCWEILIRQFSTYHRASQLYATLLSWGRYSGLPHRCGETALEFGSRLKQVFPKSSREIDIIVEAFHQENYAERALEADQLAVAQKALRTLRSPSLWASRLKSLWS